MTPLNRTAPKYADLDKVNPGSLLFSGVMMLEYIGWQEAADLVTLAYPEVVKSGIVTYDFARLMEGATEVSTSGFADAIIERIEGGIDVETKQRERQEAIRREREARDMEDAGRTPHTVGEIMTAMPVTVAPDARVDEAMHTMRHNGVSSILVEPGNDGLWGIMTQRDVVARIVHANRSPGEVSVSEIASKPLVTVPADTSLYECSSRMLESNIRRLVVVKNDAPVGIVSDTDVFRTVDDFGWSAEEV